MQEKLYVSALYEMHYAKDYSRKTDTKCSTEGVIIAIITDQVLVIVAVG